jgi:crotonobetainyl-CoA:carnitine CoA-transferase CaiB-like acyl-CoA transferase
VFDDPQVRHVGSFLRLEHAKEGEMFVVNPPVLFDGARPGPIAPPPTVGEHSEEILQELGLSGEEIAQLRRDKVI